MFPNIRLMIAAMVASIVALSCGFGVFAAFRVNHEPLVRLPPVTAPLQLIAGNTAAVAAAAPAAVAPPTESAVAPAAPAVPTVPPTAATIASTVAPTTDNRPLGAAVPEPAPAAHADAASSSQEAPAVAAVESPTVDQAPQAEQKPEGEVAPASIAKAVEDVAHKPDRKAAMSRAKRRRVVAWAYRAQGSRANAVSQFDSQYFKQSTAFSQPNFQTASQRSQRGLAQRHRLKDNSRPTEDTTAVADGPFVSPPSR